MKKVHFRIHKIGIYISQGSPEKQKIQQDVFVSFISIFLSNLDFKKLAHTIVET